MRLRVGKMMRELEEEDRVAGVKFRETVSAAPEGHYFRTLVAAVHESRPYGQPIDFPGIIRELAKMEERLEMIERRLGEIHTED